MKFQIQHETAGRLRVRCLAQEGRSVRSFSLEQGAAILGGLERVPGIRKVKLYSGAAGIAVLYRPDDLGKIREGILKALARLNMNDPDLRKATKEKAGALMLNRQYRNRLITLLARHFACKWFLPLPIRMVRGWYHTLGFIRLGLQSLRHGRLDVPVLDATAITAAMLQKDISTAGSVMLLLRVGELLEEWTYQKSVHDLADNMSLHIDTVWKVVDGSEVEVSLSDIQAGDLVSVKMGSTIPLDGEVARGDAMVNQASMTGDSERTAAAVAAKIGVDKFYAEVLPEDKARFVKDAKASGHRVVMVGDGINDSPALSEADAGVAIAEGADITREIADITISAHDLRQLVVLKQISTLLMKRVNFNYDFVVSFNAGLIGLGVMGILPPATTALLHNGSTIAISLHSMTDLMEA